MCSIVPAPSRTPAIWFPPAPSGRVPGGGESYGHSLVVSPWGDVLSGRGKTLPGVLARAARPRRRGPEHGGPHVPSLQP